MYNWANDMGYIAGNPVNSIEMPKATSDRRAFTDDERETLLGNATPELRPLWILLLLTGMRRIEAVRLSADDAVVDTPAPFLRVHGKGNKLRTIPLTPVAQEAVQYFLSLGGERLLPVSYDTIYSRWVEERDHLKLPKELTLHCFRHTFITWLANRTGTPLTEVQAAAGHATITQTQHYVHRDEAMLRAGMARLDDELVSDRYREGGENKQPQQNQGVR